MTREDAREDINRRPLTDFVSLGLSKKAGRGMYVCPVCGSGTGKKGTGALHIYPDSNRVICFAGNCFTDKGEDTLGALRIIWDCGETEALERAGYSWERGFKTTGHSKHKEYNEHQKHQEHQANDYTSFYRECHEALKASTEALEYLHGRGITDASIDRFNLGYCAAWKHPKSPNSRPTKRIIIPRTAESYTARMIEAPINEWEEDRKKQTTKQKALFNLDALEGADTVIVCEGELDAISLYQAGAASVVGIGTIVNAGTLLEEAKKHPEEVFILALDNDTVKEGKISPGREAQRKLAEDMKAAGLAVLAIDPAKIYGEAKDGNEAYTKNPERLGQVITYLQGKALEMKVERDEERAEELRKRTGEGMLDNFLLTVRNRDYEPIPTGIKEIDRAIGGGFIRKTLVLLGAAPGMGKTTAAQGIFENMARAGNDVLFLNLEMSREQLLARSISRLTWKHEREDIGAITILRGYEWGEHIQEHIERAADLYRKEIAPHFIYNPDNVTNGIDSILQAMIDETARIKAQGKPAPLVCIDYLQLIDSGERDAIEGMKDVIFRLKDFAKRENTVVFVITANNRTSNKTGTTDLESGRDTSAIEYSADLMLGLSYTAIIDHRTYKYYDEKSGKEKTAVYDLERIRRERKEAYEKGEDVPKVCREISLEVLKNRFGEADRRAKLLFDGKHNIFYEIDETYT